MKQRLFLLLAVTGLAAIHAWAGEPVSAKFSSMEINHLRVATPGLFSGNKTISIHLDSLREGEYCFPLPGAKLISGYGARRNHSGSDLKTKANDTIRCAFDGVVRMSKPYAAYGNLVVVRHANGLETVYSHNSRNLVKSGDTVKAGQPLALTGRTGRATTEHLHFEVRVNGQHFNPNLVFDLKDRSLRREEIICTKAANGIIVKTKPKSPKNNMDINKVLTEGIVFKSARPSQAKQETKIKTKAKKKTYITGLHGSGAAKMKAEIRKRRANRHKG